MIAESMGRWFGHRNGTLHNRGDTNSVFTSWSTDKHTALIHMGPKYHSIPSVQQRLYSNI